MEMEDQERIVKEKERLERLEIERRRIEMEERERKEKERLEMLEIERQRIERLEMEAKEKYDREERERLELEERHRMEKEQEELDKLEAEREETERLERERLSEREKMERLEMEEKERLERERLEREEKERLEMEERHRMEKEQEELDKLEAEREEIERLERERLEREETERLEREEKERLEREEKQKTIVIQGPGSPEISDVEVGFSSEEEGECGSQSTLVERSWRKRKTTATPCRIVQGYVITWRPRKHRSLRQPLFDYVRLNTNFSPRRMQHNNIDEDPVMLRCDGEDATLSICAGVALSRGQVCSQYVRVAGKLYEKVWAHRFEGRSRRFMLDPAFAIRVLKMENSEELDRVTRVFSRHMSGVTPNLINVVFVPVAFNNHWWCVAFSLNREEIVVMDSIETSSAADLHSLHVQQLSYAMDLVFQLLQDDWPLGTVGRWTKTSLKMDQQGDLHSCGVHMLAAIKRNADRLLTELRMDPDINVERSWLLLKDLMSEFNEARPTVLDAVSK